MAKYGLASRLRRIGAYAGLVSTMGLTSCFIADLLDPNDNPVSSYTATPTRGDAPVTSYFDGRESRDPDGRIVGGKWVFGDGSVDSTSGLTASHTYTRPGNYQTSFVAIDNDGARDSTSSAKIVVTEALPINHAPQITFGYSPDTIIVNDSVKVNFECTDADSTKDIAESYVYAGKDTVRTTSFNSSFTFAQPGTYLTGARCRDLSGATATVGPSNIIVKEASQPPPTPIQRIAYTSFFVFDQYTGSMDIWSRDINGTNIKRLTCSTNNIDKSKEICGTTETGQNIRPSYSPDGAQMVFQTSRNKIYDVYIMNAVDGSNQHKLVQTDSVTFSPTWSPDGEDIAFFYVNSICPNWSDSNCAPTKIGLGVVSSSGGKFVKLYEGPLENYLSLPEAPSFSPDRTKIAFELFKNNNFEIYVKSLSDTVLSDVGTNVSNNQAADDREPRWLPDNSGILFTSNGYIYKLDFKLGLTPITSGLNPSTSPDGKRLIFSRYNGTCTGGDPAAQIYIGDFDGTNLSNIAQLTFSEKTISDGCQSLWSSFGPIPK